jgi:alpha-galactosidase
MHPPKIVLIGAGSHSFGLMTLRDLMLTPELGGSEVVLVDIAPDKLRQMFDLAQRLNEMWGADFRIWATTDRREALPEATSVVTAVERKHYELWQLDIDIPRRMGCRHLYGENGGPGGMFHTFRQVPLLLDIAADIEALCPDAWLLNMSNPESRLCLALSRYTQVKNVGICLGAYITQHSLARRVLGLEQHEIDIKAAGINHCHWVLDIRRAGTGEDLYPEVRRRMATVDPDWEPLSQECLRRFGYFPGPADTHVGEYLPWGWKYMPEGYTDWIFRGIESEHTRGAKVQALAAGHGPLNESETAMLNSLLIEGGLRWQTVDILLSLLDNGNRYVLSLNMPNDGYITNLRQGAIVEIPAIVGADRIYGLGIGELPDAIAGLLELQLTIMDLVVDAAVLGDRQAALEALLIDPTVPDPDAAEKILDEGLRLQADYLPQFS